jgi:hypothetical protein
LTATDLADWAAYRVAYGPITIHERLDMLQAVLAYFIAKTGGMRGVDFSDFENQWADALDRRLELRTRAFERGRS